MEKLITLPFLFIYFCNVTGGKWPLIWKMRRGGTVAFPWRELLLFVFCFFFLLDNKNKRKKIKECEGEAVGEKKNGWLIDRGSLWSVCLLGSYQNSTTTSRTTRFQPHLVHLISTAAAVCLVMRKPTLPWEDKQIKHSTSSGRRLI